ncbi:MAG: carboxylate-amine ligase [Planctomycetota bacterium]
MTTTHPVHRAGSVAGIEIEYALVRRHSGDAAARAADLLAQLAGSRRTVNEVQLGPVVVCNELAGHVVELKTVEPWADLIDCEKALQEAMGRMHTAAADLGLQLVPGGMHPWFDPRRETVLWTHGQAEIYRVFDELFDCRRHGWSNVQSVQLNLPYGDDEEFMRVHDAARVLLPLIPALCASSPFRGGHASGFESTRLYEYAGHCAAVPELIGDIVPEHVISPEGYERTVLRRIARSMRAAGAPEWMQPEWCNARGAIPRLHRHAIEIRLCDAQECVHADLAVCSLIRAVVQALVEERWCTHAQQAHLTGPSLRDTFHAVLADGEAAVTHAGLRRVLGWTGQPVGARRLWLHLHRLVREQGLIQDHWNDHLAIIWQQGTCAQRQLDYYALQQDPARLRAIVARLADCLRENRPFLP